MSAWGGILVKNTSDGWVADGAARVAAATGGWQPGAGGPPRRSPAFFRGRQTGQSLRVQFFQCVMICREDAQCGTVIYTTAAMTGHWTLTLYAQHLYKKLQHLQPVALECILKWGIIVKGVSKAWSRGSFGVFYVQRMASPVTLVTLPSSFWMGTVSPIECILYRAYCSHSKWTW